MRIDQVKYFVMAALGLTGSQVYYSNQPDQIDGNLDNIVTVYGNGDDGNCHSTIRKCQYQAIVRNRTYTTGETQTRALFDAVRDNHNCSAYNGLYLTAAMDNSTNPITFAPDDGSGTTKAAQFTANDYILIGSEILKVTSVASPNVTASRAALGTTIAAHSDNDEIHNITKNPVPGETCDSSRATSGVIDMGKDDKLRDEFSLNWEVTVKL